jgi:hypothetical protein
MAVLAIAKTEGHGAGSARHAAGKKHGLIFVFEVRLGDLGVIVVRFDLIGLELVGIAGQLFVPFLFEIVIEVIVEIIIVEVFERIARHLLPLARMQLCFGFEPIEFWIADEAPLRAPLRVAAKRRNMTREFLTPPSINGVGPA